MINVKNEFGEGTLYEINDIKGKLYFVGNFCSSKTEEALHWITINRHRVTTNINEADAIIIVCCQLTNSEVYNSLTHIKRIGIKYHNKTIYVTGCLAYRFDIQCFGRRLGFVNQNYECFIEKENLFNNIELIKPIADVKHVRFTQKIALYETIEEWQKIYVSQGCNNKCSFCSVRKCIGPYKEIKPESEQKKIFLNSNHVCLTGDSVGDSVYKWLLLALEHNKYVSISHINVKTVIFCYELLKKIAENNRLAYMHCAIQSLDSKILKHMNRDAVATVNAIEYLQEFRKLGTYVLIDIILDYEMDGKIYENYEEMKLKGLFDEVNFIFYNSSVDYNEESTEKILEDRFGTGAKNHIELLDCEV